MLGFASSSTTPRASSTAGWQHRAAAAPAGIPSLPRARRRPHLRPRRTSATAAPCRADRRPAPEPDSFIVWGLGAACRRPNPTATAGSTTPRFKAPHRGRLPPDEPSWFRSERTRKAPRNHLPPSRQSETRKTPRPARPSFALRSRQRQKPLAGIRSLQPLVPTHQLRVARTGFARVLAAHNMHTQVCWRYRASANDYGRLRTTNP